MLFLVVDHLLERARLFQIFALDAPVFFYCRPVYLFRVDRRHFRDFCLNAVFLQHRLVGFGVVEHFRHRLGKCVVIFGRHLEDAEGCRVLRLTHEVGDERFEWVLSFVELYHLAERCRFDIRHLGCSVGVLPDYCADLSCFVVAGNQHLVLFRSLFHNEL